jgi:peptidoglycan/xylan/chitin deacetylase (PgdA/CDA1 family)
MRWLAPWTALVVSALALAACGGIDAATSTSGSSAPTVTTTAPPASSSAVAAMPVHRGRHHRRYPHARQAVPILMFHDVASPPASAPYPELYTPPRVFRAQLVALRRHGYHPITLRRLLSARHGRSALPAHPIILSFDDGFRGVATAALPALRRYHWPGVLFLLVRHLDQPGRWAMTSSQVRRLLHAGWELDAHGYTEVDLPALAARRVWHVVHGSREVLRRRFHVPVSFYCYPVGAYDRAVERLVRRAGYLGAVTTREGYAVAGGNPFTLPRIRVDGSEPPAELLSSLRAANQ